MSPQPHPEVTVRAATPDDISACGQICYEAFSKLSAKHSFPSDVPDVQTATNILSTLLLRRGGKRGCHSGKQLSRRTFLDRWHRPDYCRSRRTKSRRRAQAHES